MAQSLTPALSRTTYFPQPWDRYRSLGRRDVLELDFACHLVGHFRFRLEPDGVVDAPTRLRLMFAERPEDLALPPEPHSAQLSRAWVQDEVITLDDLPAEVALPRRYAFRYVRIEVIDTSRAFKVRLTDASADSLTSAEDAAAPPCPRTLRTTSAGSMQSVWPPCGAACKPSLRTGPSVTADSGPATSASKPRPTP